MPATAFFVWTSSCADGGVFCLLGDPAAATPRRHKSGEDGHLVAVRRNTADRGTILRGLPPERSVVRCLGVRGHSKGPPAARSSLYGRFWRVLGRRPGQYKESGDPRIGNLGAAFIGSLNGPVPAAIRHWFAAGRSSPRRLSHPYPSLVMSVCWV